MAKVLVIPDTHVRDFWKKAKEIIDNYDKVVFLGDYVDPYEHEFNLNKKELRQKTIKDFKEIIEFAKQYSDKVVLLDGNHLLHYFNTMYACSRFDNLIADEIETLYCENQELFHRCYLIDNVLFTHAGVSEQWVSYVSSMTDIPYENNPVEFINKCPFNYLMSCDWYRGGRDMHSGPEWLDVHQLAYEVSILPGYYHVFGHTSILKAIKEPSYACVDTQELYELDTLTREINCLENF